MRRWACLLIVAVLPACDWMPGKPDPADRWQPPEANRNFSELYAQNCRGCHGIDGTIAGSNSLDQPTYLAYVTPEALRNAIANGVPGSNMPAFARSHGGMLTDAQVGILVDGLLAKRQPQPGPVPPYEGQPGDPVAGHTAFGIFCASCHGADGTGAKAGSVVDSAYLGLVTNQYLRTVTVAGRPELGCPDFRSRVEGRQMSDEDISNIVDWLASQRRNEFGQPLPPTTR
ncbi:MAG: hypothetical protein Fur0032_07170 [Terrimicrobiaceae bacterium]